MATDHNGIIYQRRNVYIVYQSWDPDVFIGSAVPDHHASGRENASGRALKILKNSGMLYESEVREARSVLTAAALTYVASAASALLQLLRILILTGGRRNDDE